MKSFKKRGSTPLQAVKMSRGIEYHHTRDFSKADAEAIVKKLYRSKNIYHASSSEPQPKKVLVLSADQARIDLNHFKTKLRETIHDGKPAAIVHSKTTPRSELMTKAVKKEEKYAVLHKTSYDVYVIGERPNSKQLQHAKKAME